MFLKSFIFYLIYTYTGIVLMKIVSSGYSILKLKLIGWNISSMSEKKKCKNRLKEGLV